MVLRGTAFGARPQAAGELRHGSAVHRALNRQAGRGSWDRMLKYSVIYYDFESEVRLASDL